MIETTKALEMRLEDKKVYTDAEDVGKALARLPEAVRKDIFCVIKGAEIATEAAAHRAG